MFKIRYTLVSLCLVFPLLIQAKPSGSNDMHGSIAPFGNIKVEDGASQTFQITPDSGYYISDVAVDKHSVGRVTSYTFTNVTNDHILAVSFEPNPEIQASTIGHGAITPSGVVVVANYGADQQFNLKPDDGYQINNVLVDGGTGIGSVNTYTFTHVTSDHSIVGIFTPLKIMTSRPGAFIYTDIGDTNPNKNIVIYNGNNVAATDITYSLENSLHNVPMPSGTCSTIAPHAGCTMNFQGVDKTAYGNGNLNLQYKLDGSSKTYITPVRIAVNNAVLALQDQAGKGVTKIEFPKSDAYPISQSFSIKNTGKFILQTARLNLSDSHGGKFSIINDSCSGSNLALNDVCTFAVQVSEQTIAGENTSNLVITGGNIKTTTIPIEVDGNLTITPDLSDAKRHLSYRAIYLHNTTGSDATINNPILDGDLNNRVKYCAFGDNSCSYQSCDISKPLADNAECLLWFHALNNPSDNLSKKSGTITINSKTFPVNYDKSLYLGGSFTKASDGTVLNRFTKYDGTGFQSLGFKLNKKLFKNDITNQGLNNTVNTFALAPDGDLYLGGDFTSSSDNTTNMYHAARYDGSQIQGLLPINAGVDDSVYSLAFSLDKKLYLGGSFKSSLNNIILNRVAAYKDNTFVPLQNGLDGGSVYALTFTPNGDLYVGGDFQQSKNLLVHRIAKYTEANGFTVLNGSGLDGLVNAIAYSPTENKIYVGGVFLKAKDDGSDLNHITKYNPGTDTFESLGNTYAPGLSNDVQSLAFFDNTMYMGGDFVNARDGTVLHRITKYLSDKFQQILPGIYRFGADATHVNVLTFDSQHNLYLGGDFTVIDDNNHNPLNGIAKYDLNNQTYQMLGTGLDVSNAAVNALVVAPALVIGE